MYPQENKKNIEIHEGYTQVYILNIFSTQSILFTWSKNGRWSPNTIINNHNNNNKNKTCKWSLECYMVIKWKTSNKYFTYTIIDMSLQ